MAHGDKRSVSTDALETLGTILGEGQGRDAIHLAVEPAIAAEDLMVGQHVGFKEGGMGSCAETLGIVDPFLLEGPRKGERFWLVVYPRQITSLRHVWSHPAFPESVLSTINISSSEKWLRDFCVGLGESYEQIVEAAKTGSSGQRNEYGVFTGITFNGEYFCTWGYDGPKGAMIPNEFWDHLESVTGKRFSTRADYFSCSC